MQINSNPRGEIMHLKDLAGWSVVRDRMTTGFQRMSSGHAYFWHWQPKHPENLWNLHIVDCLDPHYISGSKQVWLRNWKGLSITDIWSYCYCNDKIGSWKAGTPNVCRAIASLFPKYLKWKCLLQTDLLWELCRKSGTHAYMIACTWRSTNVSHDSAIHRCCATKPIRATISNSREPAGNCKYSGWYSDSLTLHLFRKTLFYWMYWFHLK